MMHKTRRHNVCVGDTVRATPRHALPAFRGLVGTVERKIPWNKVSILVKEFNEITVDVADLELVTPCTCLTY